MRHAVGSISSAEAERQAGRANGTKLRPVTTMARNFGMRDFGYLPCVTMTDYSSGMWKICLAVAFFVLIPVSSLAEGPATISKKIDSAFVQQTFGDQFTLLTNVAPVFGDLDGDGVEDVVIAARCKNPMLDQGDRAGCSSGSRRWRRRAS